MSSLSLYYCDASALGKVAVGLVMSLFFRNLRVLLGLADCGQSQAICMDLEITQIEFR